MNKIISFDLSSGDKGSIEALAAAIDFCVLNKDWKIKGFVKEKIEIPNKPNNLEIIQCNELIEQNDGPLQVRRKKDSTLVRAMESVNNNEAAVALSAAASGPLVTAGYLIFKSIEGIKPAFAPIFFNKDGKPRIMLDVGANLDVDALTLNQFAVMGSLFSKSMGFSQNPIVMQLNIGTEDKKGRTIQQEAFNLMKNNHQINFKGNIEANNALIENEVNVIVTEAYSGNILLKSYEGAFKIFKSIMKESANNSFLDKIGFTFAKNFRSKIKVATNSDAGAVPVLGLNKLLLKAHGNSSKAAFFNSLNDAKKLIEKDLVNQIKEKINNL
ncbi:MAG: phosphate acyltransferase [Candidatus Tyloplasma litorale]|nr:MAG: phosphate acyltransferase [Mycoplasmatales bacterium]